MTTKKIILTGRVPVEVDTDTWARIAYASDSWHDSEHECQANRSAKAWIAVRRHDDGRMIVYGHGEYSSAFRGERDHSWSGGRIVESVQSVAEIVGEIVVELGNIPGIAAEALGRSVLADMPAEKLP